MNGKSSVDIISDAPKAHHYSTCVYSME